MAKVPIDYMGLLSELRRGFVPGEVSSKQGLFSYVPSWVGERGEGTCAPWQLPIGFHPGGPQPRAFNSILAHFAYSSRPG